MSEHQLIYGMIIVGVVLSLASLLVDVVGVGTDGFGVGQLVGLMVGVILIAVGIHRRFMRLTSVL